MTFSESVKKEFVGDLPRATCCRRALAYGLLFDADIDGERVYFETNSVEFAELYVRLLERQFSKAVSVCELRKAGKKYYGISFAFASVSQKIALLSENEARPCDYVEFKCADCRAYFLRGVFLARGTLTMSPGNNHLEYRIIHKERARFLADLLSACGISPKRVERGRVVGLYFKRGEQIEDNLNLMQANEALFSVMNERIEREIKIQERRIANCDSVNILRSVETAQRQIKAIKVIEGAGLLDKLDAGLRETARLRVENDTATMAELTILHSEPISKSGLNARFAKITKIAENITKNS